MRGYRRRDDHPAPTSTASTVEARRRQKAGIPESEFVANMAEAWRSLWDELGISADEFVAHHRSETPSSVQWLFKLCKENGFVYKGHYTRSVLHLRQRFRERREAPVKLPGLRPPARNAHRGKITSSSFPLFKATARFLSQESRFIQPEKPQKRNCEFRRRRPARSSASRAHRFAGVFPSPAKSRTVFYVWFDALTAYLSAVGGPDYEKRGMWPAECAFLSAKTSSASTPSTGRRS